MKLFEVMSKLNKVSINERYNITDEVYATLTTSLDVLERGELLTENGGKYDAKSQSGDDGYYVEIDGSDREGNIYGFTFNVEFDEGLDDDVVNVLNVDLIEFYFDSMDDSEEIKLDENDLREFNKQINISYYDTITKYINIDLESDIEKIK